MKLTNMDAWRPLLTLLVVNLLWVLGCTSSAQDKMPNPVITKVLSTESRSLTCQEATALFKGQPFADTRTQGLFALSLGESRFQPVSAICDGVSTEGKSGKEMLGVTPGIQTDPTWSRQIGRPIAVDPFSVTGKYVKPGTLYEFKVLVLFTLYNTGWMMDSVEVQSGQRASSKQ